MILLLLLLCPLALGFITLCSGRWAPLLALCVVIINFCEALYAWIVGLNLFLEPWIAEWGVHVHLRLDGLSFAMITVAHIMALSAIIGSWAKIREKIALFYANILWLLAGVIGVLLSVDLLLFFVFWEIMIIPLYVSTTLWGGAHRLFASVQFLIFTQVSGLIMLLSILALYFAHHAQTGIFSFDFDILAHTELSASSELWILLGFLAAFLVKLPAFGFHVWLPAIFEASPIAPLLVGIMVKTGAYGILRFAIPLFPHACSLIAPFMMALGALGIIYGAVLAFSQNDLRKILAYATISHMGVVLMALFSMNALAYNGVIILLVTEALSTGGLLLLFSHLGEFDLKNLGGLWARVPKLSVVGLFLIMSSIGLPFMGNFVGEWLAMVGIFSVSIGAACIMALGLVLSAIYYLRLIQKIFFGPLLSSNSITVELSFLQMLLFSGLISLLLGIGFYPEPLLSVIDQTNFVVKSGSYE